MLEKEFQTKLIRTIKMRFIGSVVLKTDPTYIQGFPDLIVLYGDCWAALECKRSGQAKKSPNQSFYVEELKKMGYSSFVYPENMEDVMNEMEEAFGLRRKTRFSGGE